MYPTYYSYFGEKIYPIDSVNLIKENSWEARSGKLKGVGQTAEMAVDNLCLKLKNEHEKKFGVSSKRKGK